MLVFIPPGFILAFLFLLFGIESSKICFFGLAYFWHVTVFSPFMIEKFQHEKHKYSFLRQLIKLHDFYLSFDPYQKYPANFFIARLIGPLLFSSLLAFISGDLGHLLYALLGSLVFELYCALVVLKDQFAWCKAKSKS